MTAFYERRRVDTLKAMVPLADDFGWSRAELGAFASSVAKLPPRHNEQWAQVDRWPTLELRGTEHLHRNDGRGTIVVPSHFGGYHWSTTGLLQAGAHVTLLVDARNRAEFDADHDKRLLPRFVAGGEFDAQGFDAFETVESEDPASLWTLSKALKRERCVLMFVDGNSGVEGRLRGRGAVELNFLGRPIWARPGIVALAETSGAAIVTLHTRLAEDTSRAVLEFQPPTPIAEGNRSERHRATMQGLFDDLDRQVRARPDQWEEWWLLPKWWTHAPAPARRRQGVRPPVLTGPALARLRLMPSSLDHWVVPTPAGPAVADLHTDEVFQLADDVLEVFEQAKLRPLVNDWLREQQPRAKWRAALGHALDAGLVTLVRD
ncbi:MAG: hypothetical protein AAGA54_17700 [Myxococcota bacterium]